MNVGPICISASVADLVFQLGDYKLIESHQSEVYNFFCIHDFDAVVNQTTKEISQPKKISLYYLHTICKNIVNFSKVP